MTSLFKLFGAIESLKYSFPQVQEVKIVFVSAVKQLYRQVYHQKEKTIEGLNYKAGRGGG
jgi:tetrahydromethanopterin S-methyltransferase subunit H